MRSSKGGTLGPQMIAFTTVPGVNPFTSHAGRTPWSVFQDGCIRQLLTQGGFCPARLLQGRNTFSASVQCRKAGWKDASWSVSRVAAQPAAPCAIQARGQGGACFIGALGAPPLAPSLSSSQQLGVRTLDTTLPPYSWGGRLRKNRSPCPLPVRFQAAHQAVYATFADASSSSSLAPFFTSLAGCFAHFPHGTFALSVYRLCI